jgi:hypothetical protein
MPDSGENVRFQVLVNGEVRGTAGLESVGVLSVILDWVRRDTAAPERARRQPGFRENDWAGDQVHVSLGGLDSAAGEHVEWFVGELRVGDEVVVRVLPPGEFDSPPHRHGAREGG